MINFISIFMQKNFYKNKKGFFAITDLAISITIMGILIGGITGGAALIETAKVRVFVSDVDKFRMGISLYKNEYDIVPGGLTNTLDYYSNSAYQDSATSPHACMRTGNNIAIAAEGTGNINISGKKTGAAISSPLTIAADKTELTWSSVAHCQLYASGYLENKKGNIVSIGNMLPNVNALAAKIASTASIIFITNKVDKTQNLVIGNANLGTAAAWNGKYETIEGNIAGKIIKKVDVKMNTPKSSLKILTAEKSNLQEDGSAPTTGSSGTACDYASKKPECVIRINLDA